MKNLFKFLSIIGLSYLLTINSVLAVTTEDYKEVIKATKKMCKLSNQNNIDELSKYYSENYKSFDGYNKEKIIEIYKLAFKLYPNAKSKEKITNIETKDDYIKVYIDEASNTNLAVTGNDAVYAPVEKVKGRMDSKSKYSMTFKKENDKWLVVSDEIYMETTEIKYGEALKANFQMDVPESIKEGEEFTVKTTIEMPKDRYVVGSIGHDKVVFPPEKYLDPYRAINETGILERVMIANKEGKNEYANSTFAFVSTYIKKKKGKILEHGIAVSGMGIYVKRMNLKKDDVL